MVLVRSYLPYHHHARRDYSTPASSGSALQLQVVRSGTTVDGATSHASADLDASMVRPHNCVQARLHPTETRCRKMASFAKAEQERARQMKGRLEFAESLSSQLATPSSITSQSIAAYTELLDSCLLDVALEVHRGARADQPAHGNPVRRVAIARWTESRAAGRELLPSGMHTSTPLQATRGQASFAFIGCHAIYCSCGFLGTGRAVVQGRSFKRT